ncbi:hypothetical protein VHEMI02452 [[Torrubiella] hemipterigena]|uniref:Zn(2)-C6 fungal-type domain-containing protein n=1 Tax=[Torrubiella] hemipterigena TaxID=1531966 RepID=A0A0A1T882_9HYPO|nr:hypothetical protein VHEMI02452 [[Torrubiella] hemipterigena]
MMISSTIPPIAKRRACVVCTAAKAKCTPQTANLCQRCARLGKACTYLNMPQTKRRHKNGQNRRIEELEAKVHQLTSELARFTQMNNQTSSSVSKSVQSQNIAHSSEPDPPGDADLLVVAEYSSHGVEPSTTSALAHQASIVDQGLITREEAKYLVDEFCTNFVPKFPFAVLSRNETAAHLKDKAPFLLLCIVGVVMHTEHHARKTIMEEIMKHISVRVVTHSERSLMLLRGLLIHCAWYRYPALKNHPQLLLLVQLCVSMVYDLGLHKKCELKDDEKRALLGTYWLSVGIFSGLGRPAVMKHNSRIDSCIEQMSNSTEHASDRWLVSIVQLQSFLARIDESYEAIKGSRGGTMLVIATRNSLQRQLQSITASIEQVLASWPTPTGILC